jgi:hypothetical protein
MDSNYVPDLDELRRHLERSEVVGLYFPLLRRTLLLDTRTSEVDRPLVMVVPMVNSMEERLRSLKRLRPRFPRPESMVLVPWPKSVGSLRRLGVWDLVLQRLESAGGATARARCEQAFRELANAERQHLQNAITGEGFRTLWQRGG